MPTTHWAMLSHPVSELATGIEKIFFPASDATSNAGPCAANSGASAAAATSAFSSSSFSADTPPSAPPDAAESAVEPAVVSAGASAVESAVVPAVESLLLASSSLPQAAATSDRATTDATTSRRRVDGVVVRLIEVGLIEVGLIEVGLMVQSPFLLMVHVWNASHEPTPRESWLVGGCTIHGRRAPLPISHSPSHVLASPHRPPDRLDCPIIRTIESGCRNHGS